MSMVHELSDPNRRVAGSKQVMRYARLSALEKVFVAKDADEAVINSLQSVCDMYHIPFDMSHTMHQLGSACEIEVGSACAGVLKAKK